MNILFDPAVAYSMVFQPQFVYPVIVFVIGYFGWDRYIRKAFRIHICLEDGQSLQEMISLKVPLKRAGTAINWIVHKETWSGKTKKDGVNQSTQGKSYLIDPKDVLYKDRFNKFHIIVPYDNVFSFHPYSDINGKIAFMTLATAKAESLFQVIATQGMVGKVLSLKAKLTSNMSTTTIAFIGLLAFALGVLLNPLLPIPHQQFAQPVASNATTITHTVTSVIQTTLGGNQP